MAGEAQQLLAVIRELLRMLSILGPEYLAAYGELFKQLMSTVILILQLCVIEFLEHNATPSSCCAGEQGRSSANQGRSLTYIA